MGGVLRNLGALMVAATSFALTIGLVLVIERLIGFNLFSLMWWGVIPLGAFLTGLLAASGYYFGALKLQLKPTRSVAFGMLFVAAMVQEGLYYAHYRLAQTETGLAISEYVTFPRYVGWSLSHTKYGLVVYGYRPGGADGSLDVGMFGYIIAVLQFLALAVGGFIAYAILADRPYCDACRRFLERSVKFQLPFAGELAHVSELHRLEPLSPEHFTGLAQLPSGNTAALEMELSICSGCAREAITEKPMFAKSGKLTYAGEAFRTSWNLTGVSVSRQMAALAQHSAKT